MYYEELFEKWYELFVSLGLDGQGLEDRLYPQGKRRGRRAKQIGDLFEITIVKMWCQNDPRPIWELIEAIHRSRLELEFNKTGRAKQLFANSF
jgi:hypothetical protein